MTIIKSYGGDGLAIIENEQTEIYSLSQIKSAVLSSKAIAQKHVFLIFFKEVQLEIFIKGHFLKMGAKFNGCKKFENFSHGFIFQ